MTIDIKSVRSNAAKLAVNSLIIYFVFAGVFIILALFILGGFMHLNLQKNPWPLVLLAIDVFGALTIIPIVYFVAKNSKKLQIRYIRDIIDSKYNYAKVLRSYSGEFSQKVYALADEKFSELTKVSSEAIDYTVEQWKVVEIDMENNLELTWKKVMRKIDETNDKDIKQDIFESYLDHKAEILEHMKAIKLLFETKKYNTIEGFQKQVDIYMNSREKMITSNTERNEAYAIEQETIAKNWEEFLKNNY